MKIGVIIPDRGDRPQFLKNCQRMIGNQTLRASNVVIVDNPPTSDQCDITKRYRTGYDIITRDVECGFGVDLIAFIENDDWYHPQYLETMSRLWHENQCPELFGINFTVYYHLKLRRYFVFRHAQRASAMSTFIKPGLKIEWPADHDPYTDGWLWLRPNIGIQTRVAIDTPNQVLAIGMKHGIGKTGGEFHINSLNRFDQNDNGYLQATLDSESYKFFSSIVL